MLKSLVDTILNDASIGILIVQDADVLYRNGAARDMLRPVSGNVADLKQRIHQAEHKKFEYVMKMATRAETDSADFEIRCLLPPCRGDGGVRRYRWLRWQCRPIAPNGRPAALITLIDITRAKEMERLATTRAKMASLGHVAAGISHEIRNPLSGISLFLDALRERFPEIMEDADVAPLLKHATSGVGKIERVIQRVMDFSRSSNPQLRLSNILTPIEEAVGLSRVTLKKAGIRLTTRFDPDLPELYLDGQLIEQVMLNLITNGAEAMAASGGEKGIEIQVDNFSDGVRIQVQDSGPGIDPRAREKIFDPFYSTKQEGVGIGLNLCQRIIADHGGTIRADCPDTGGTRFTVYLPREKRSIPRKEADGPGESEETRETGSGDAS